MPSWPNSAISLKWRSGRSISTSTSCASPFGGKALAVSHAIARRDLFMPDAPLGVLVMAYGGPDKLDDVEPYLRDVRNYRPTPPEIVHEIRERYERIGGRSPILELTRTQAGALQVALDREAAG